jgi:hypothetical protein
MKKLIAKIVAWFRSRNITSHAVAGLATMAAGAYAADPDVRAIVLSLLQTHPKIVAGIGTACVLWMKYSSAHSAIGVLQQVPEAKAELAKQGVLIQDAKNTAAEPAPKT